MMIFQLSFEPPRVKTFEEYLVYDMIAMISAIGGTMGLCIGFSFTEFSFATLKLMENIVINHLSRNRRVDNTIQPSDYFQKGIALQVHPVSDDVSQKIDKLKKETEFQVQRLEARLLALERN